MSQSSGKDTCFLAAVCTAMLPCFSYYLDYLSTPTETMQMIQQFIINSTAVCGSPFGDFGVPGSDPLGGVIAGPAFHC